MKAERKAIIEKLGIPHVISPLNETTVRLQVHFDGEPLFKVCVPETYAESHGGWLDVGEANQALALAYLKARAIASIRSSC